jgi:hypothetical protein
MQNYVVTQYSAEIINTLTNLLFMYLAAKGIRSCLKNGHDTVFLVAFAGYLLVGSGSFLFHMTLKCTFITVLSPQSRVSDSSQTPCSLWMSSR